MIRHTCVHVNMADNSSNSDSTSNSSDLEIAGADEIAESNVDPFQGIQPWRFGLNCRIPCHSKTHLESVATRLRSYTARMLSGYVATELHSYAA